MTLGERIYHLRNERNMTQGDLADALGVSRQSISKWETNSAVPELDKLVKLGEYFGVSMDALILGEQQEPQDQPEESVSAEHIEAPAPTRDSPSRKTVGLILLCFGGLVILLFTLLGGFLAGLLFSSPFLLCGVICLVFIRNVGLWCAWAIFFSVNIYLRYATGITWRLTLWTFNYEPSMNYLRLAFAWLEVVWAVTMVVITLRRFWKAPIVATKKTLVLLTAGWILFALLFIPLRMDPLSGMANVVYIFLDWIKLGLLTALILATVRLIRSRAENKV